MLLCCLWSLLSTWSWAVWLAAFPVLGSPVEEDRDHTVLLCMDQTTACTAGWEAGFCIRLLVGKWQILMQLSGGVEVLGGLYCMVFFLTCNWDFSLEYLPVFTGLWDVRSSKHTVFRQVTFDFYQWSCSSEWLQRRSCSCSAFSARVSACCWLGPLCPGICCSGPCSFSSPLQCFSASFHLAVFPHHTSLLPPNLILTHLGITHMLAETSVYGIALSWDHSSTER